MTRRSLVALAAGAAALVLALSAGVVLTAPDTAIPWSVFGASGNSSSSTNYDLASTSGQSSPIGQSTSANYELGAGFWAGIACPNDNDGLTTNEEAGLGTDRCKYDTDEDGCGDGQELGLDEAQGGLRDPKNAYDFYDVLGPGAALPVDGIIDLPNDILGVIQHYAPTGTEPRYDVNFDRGPRLTGPVWNMTAPDGVIDLPNDILGVIRQFNHSCQ